jgi:hypothetical protein
MEWLNNPRDEVLSNTKDTVFSNLVGKARSCVEGIQMIYKRNATTMELVENVIYPPFLSTNLHTE